jgi:hypothetical protein
MWTAGGTAILGPMKRRDWRRAAMLAVAVVVVVALDGGVSASAGSEKSIPARFVVLTLGCGGAYGVEFAREPGAISYTIKYYDAYPKSVQQGTFTEAQLAALDKEYVTLGTLSAGQDFLPVTGGGTHPQEPGGTPCPTPEPTDGGRFSGTPTVLVTCHGGPCKGTPPGPMGVGGVAEIKVKDPKNPTPPSVAVRHRGSSTFTPLNVGDHVQVGDEITTNANTVTAIEFSLGGRVWVNSNSEIVITGPRRVTGPDSVRVDKGSLWVRLEKMKEPIEIQTNGGFMGIRD